MDYPINSSITYPLMWTDAKTVWYILPVKGIITETTHTYALNLTLKIRKNRLSNFLNKR